MNTTSSWTSSPYRERRGQTLVEALIALSVVTVGLLGVIALLTRSFVLNRTVTDDTQATYLASEGIEIAKNIIDYDLYYGIAQGPGVNDWGCSFALGAGQTAHYELDYSTAPPANCGVLAADPNAPTDHLYYNPTTALYSYHAFGGSPTNFTRDVQITNNGNYFGVTSIVTWTDGTLGNTITLQDFFYHWHP